jgi:hypothetical protein
MLNVASVAATWGSSIVGSTKAVTGFLQASGTVGVNVSNGTAVTASPGAFVASISDSPIAIGARTAGTDFAAVKYAEIVVCSTMPSAPQLAALQAYAVGRYGNV